MTDQQTNHSSIKQRLLLLLVAPLISLAILGGGIERLCVELRHPLILLCLSIQARNILLEITKLLCKAINLVLCIRSRRIGWSLSKLSSKVLPILC